MMRTTILCVLISIILPSIFYGQHIPPGPYPEEYRKLVEGYIENHGIIIIEGFWGYPFHIATDYGLGKETRVVFDVPYRDHLEKIINSINDEEAIDVFETSKSIEMWVEPFGYLGGLIVARGIYGATQMEGSTMEKFLGGTLATGIGVGIAVPFPVWAHKKRVKSVKRYNDVVREMRGLSQK